MIVERCRIDDSRSLILICDLVWASERGCQLQVVHDPLIETNLVAPAKQSIASCVDLRTGHILDLHDGGGLIELCDAEFVTRAYWNFDSDIWITSSEPATTIAIVVSFNDVREEERKLLRGGIVEFVGVFASYRDFVRLVTQL